MKDYNICQNQNVTFECTDRMHRKDLVDNLVEMSAERVQAEVQHKFDEITEWLKAVA